MSNLKKVLIVHVPYEHRGGEDVHVDALIEGYREIGVEPILFPTNRQPPQALLKKSLLSLWPTSQSPDQALEQIWNQEQPLYIHLHNAFPILGPRFFRWIIAKNAKVVMTVHNHRFFCTNGLALRNKKICKDCFNSKIAWRSVLYNCNGDFKKTVYHSLALTQMRINDLYARSIKRFVAPSPYLQAELVKAGIPRERVLHILNPVFRLKAENLSKENEIMAEKYDAIYAGRLSQEKGIQELIQAIERLPNVRFVLAGDGPERALVERAALLLKNLIFLGPVSHEKVLDLISQSRIAVLSSICNETLSTFALEAFFQGKRCVVPALDSTSWLASGDFPGHLAKPGNPEDLANTIRAALDSNRVSKEQKEKLQLKLGFQRFCLELNALVQEMLNRS